MSPAPPWVQDPRGSETGCPLAELVEGCEARCFCMHAPCVLERRCARAPCLALLAEVLFLMLLTLLLCWRRAPGSAPGGKGDLSITVPCSRGPAASPCAGLSGEEEVALGTSSMETSPWERNVSWCNSAALGEGKKAVCGQLKTRLLC